MRASISIGPHENGRTSDHVSCPLEQHRSNESERSLLACAAESFLSEPSIKKMGEVVRQISRAGMLIVMRRRIEE